MLGRACLNVGGQVWARFAPKILYFLQNVLVSSRIIKIGDPFAIALMPSQDIRAEPNARERANEAKPSESAYGDRLWLIETLSSSMLD